MPVRTVPLFMVIAGLTTGMPTEAAGRPNAKDTSSVSKSDPAEAATHLRGPLDNCRIRFQRDKTGRVVFLGGSITHMKGWREMVCQWLTQRFPATNFDFIDAGIPSTDTAFGPFRLERDVFAKGPVDLLFVEFAVNDSTNGRSPTDSVRGMEGIIRHARRVCPELDIVMLHFVDPDKMAHYRAGRTPPEIASHERVAEHYNVSSIELAREVTERIDRGELTWKQFGGIHPAPRGHRLCTASIQRLFEHAWSRPLPEGAKAQPHPMPDKPLDRFNYGHGRLVDIKQAEIVRGWKIDPNWKPTKGSTREGFVNVPMLVADGSGAAFTLDFQGSAVGLLHAAGYDVGMIEASIDGGPAWRIDLYTQWSNYLHIPWATIIAADLEPGRHRLTIRMSKQKNPKSENHAARIVAFLVNGGR